MAEESINSTGPSEDQLNRASQLGQTMSQAAEKASSFRFAMESSAAAADNLQKKAQAISFDPDLAATFKIFQEDSKAVISNIKKYPGLIDKATKSNKGLQQIEAVISKAQQDNEGIREAATRANQVYEESINSAKKLGLQIEEHTLVLQERKADTAAAFALETEKSVELGQAEAAIASTNLAIQNNLAALQTARALNDKEAIESLAKENKALIDKSNFLSTVVQSRQEELQDATAALNVAEASQKTVQDALDLTKKQAKATEEAGAAAKDYARSLNASLDTAEAFLDTLEEAKSQTLELNSATKVFGTLANLANADFLKSLPLFGEMANSFSKAEEAARQVHIETKGAATAAHLFGAAFKAIGIGLLLGFVAKLVEGIGEASNRMSDLAMELNVSKTEAGALLSQYDRIAKASGQAYTSQQDFIKAQNELNQLLGTSATITADQGLSFSYMTERLGVAASSAANLLKYTSAVGKNAQDFTEEVVGQVQLFNVQNDQVISFSEVLEDISKSSARTRLTLSKFPGGITRAALQARNLGLTLDDIVGASESFLDFESSIQAELEAELLTGKQLNLEQARLAALKGDTAKVAEEIAKQNITASDFASMNVIQQEALAKAVGLSVDKLAESLETQEAQAAAARATAEALTGTSGLSKEAIKKQVDALLNLEEQELKQEAINKLSAEAQNYLYKEELKRIDQAEKQAKIAGKTFDRAAALNALQKQYGKSQKALDDKNISNREKFEKIQNRIGDAFVKLALGFEPLIDSVLTFVENLAMGADYVGMIGDKFASFTNPFTGSDNVPKELGKEVSKEEGDSSGPSGVKIAAGIAGTVVAGLAAKYGFQKLGGLKDSLLSKVGIKSGELGSNASNPLFTQDINGDGGSGIADSVSKVLTKKGPFKKLQQIAKIFKGGKGQLLKGGLGKVGKLVSKIPGIASQAGNIGKSALSTVSKAPGAAKTLASGGTKLLGQAGKLITKLPLGKLAGVLGKVAAPLAAAKAAYDGFKGFTADPQAELGDKLKNAGESILNGLSFGFIGRNAEEIAADASKRIAAEANKAKSAAEAAGMATAASLQPTSSQAVTSSTEQSIPESSIQTTNNVSTNTESTVIERDDSKLATKFDMLAKKLDSINSSITQGGDVYIDGNKAGKALVLASTKMS